MRLFSLFFLIVFICFNAFGQKKARDFKVTTSDKNQIELYKDYLNKGKVVLLQIFFVDCPPCNDIAPQISQLYKKYGSGKDKVEFIELSNKLWDYDPAVIAFKQQYDLPFPSASNSGGSVEAAALYSDNFYGPFYGTPTFAVIKTDGTVDFDPRGNNRNETVNLLDASLARAIATIPPPVDTIKPVPPADTMKPKPPTDTIKPTPPTDTVKPKPVVIDTIKLSGRLFGFNKGLGLVNITLSWNGKTHKFNTDLSGNFKLNLLDTAKINGAASFQFDYSLPANYEVSALDLLIIQKHILSIAPFTDFQHLLAADVNADGDINVIDLLELRKVILGITDTLPNNTPSFYMLFKNSNNLIKSITSPVNYSELKAMSGKHFEIEVIKTGNVN